MRDSDVRLGLLIVLVCPGFNTAVQGQSLPAYVVDAQVPVVSSDGFNAPQGLAVAPGGAVYVADSGNHRLLKIAPDGTQTTVSFGAFGPAAQTMSGLATDALGDLFVADTATNRLIKLPAGGGHALTILGAPLMDRPTAVASDAAGDVAVVNSGNATVVVRRYGPAAVLNTGSTVLIAPTAVAFDNKGLVYVADAGNGTTPGAVYKFPLAGGTGTALPLTGYALRNVTGLGSDDARNLYVLDGGAQQLIEVPVSGGAAFLIPQSNFKSPSGLTLDNLGNLYVSDSGATSNTVTELVYRNAANFGSVQVGATSGAITFNYEFYERTVVEAVRGVGGGIGDAEYRKAPGGTCGLITYFPTTSSTGLTLPASCTAKFNFQPAFPGGRQGVVQVQTPNGNDNQLVVGTGMGAQLALMNATITGSLVSISHPAPMAVNHADTQIYFCGPGGTYRIPVGGLTPTLVTTETGGSIALNGAEDLFLFDGSKITKIPADGSASTVINVPGLINPQAMAMDSNGAFYISDLGPPQSPSNNYTIAGFIMRVSPNGVASKLSPAGYWQTPSLMASDGQGNIFIADGGGRLVFKVAGWTGNFTQMEAPASPTIGGYYGISPQNLAVDASGTIYYWDSYINQNFTGLAYSPPGGESSPYGGDAGGETQLPLYTIPEVFDNNGGGSFYPFYSASGNQTMVTSPNGKLYVVNGNGPGVFIVDRTKGNIPWKAFDPNAPFVGGPAQWALVYNTGNQNATFTGATAFTESGNGVGSFTFSGPAPPNACQPGTVIAPSNYCTIYVTNTNAFNSGPIVTDTLHFLTDAMNNNLVSFKIYGFGPTAP